MNWLLLVVAIILLASALKGYQNGFLKTMFGLISIIVALVVSTVASPMLSKTLRENKSFMTGVSERLEQVVHVDSDIKKSTEETDYINQLNLPKSIKETLLENNNVDVYKAMAIDNFNDYIINLLSVVVINTLSYIACFVLSLIALFLLSHILNLISKLPLLNELNKSAGLFAGLFGGCIKVWIFFVVITIFSATSFGENIFKMIGDSRLLTFIYDNNLLMKFITNISANIL